MDAPDLTVNNLFMAVDVERLVYGTVLHARSPASVKTIADRAGCDPKRARKYADWFAELGIVIMPDSQHALV